MEFNNDQTDEKLILLTLLSIDMSYFIFIMLLLCK